MPWRYIIFSTLVLGSAFGASKWIIVARDTSEGTTLQEIRPSAATRLTVEDKVPAKKVSGSSIAPGGVGGRQSQFSAVLGDNHS